MRTFIPIPEEMYRRARLIGGGNGVRQYDELRAYVAGKSPHTLVDWTRDKDGDLYAVVDSNAVLKTRKAVRGRPRPA